MTNWTSPNGLNQRETSLQELIFPEGDATIETNNGEMRGEQVSKAVYDGNSARGGEAEPAEDDDSAAVNEFNLFVVVAKHDDVSQDILRKRIITEGGW